MTIFPSFFVNKTGAYEIEQSLRFNSGDSTNLTKTFSSAGNRQIFTISFWFKNTQGSSNIASLMFAGNTSDWSAIEGIGTQNIRAYDYNPDRYSFGTTNASFRDPSAWMHFVFRLDNTSSDRTNYAQIWINGVRQSVASQGSGTQNTSGHFFNNIQHYIGNNAFGSYLNGYLAEFHACDGQLKDATDFGEPDNNGVWRPIRYTGSYGTNGFYLKFDPTATNGIGHDHSGNGNNFTATGFSTSGTGTDVMSDTPTTNWATLNPLDNGGNTVSNGNLVVNTSAGFDLIRSTFFLSSGKWYWEVTADDGGDGFVGISSAEESLSSRGAETANSATILTTNGNIRTSASNSAYGSAVSDGDVMMFALDMDAGKFWAGKNGTWFNSGDPAAGTNAGKTGLTVPVSPSISVYDNEDYTANFGQRDFEYTPPTGFKALNTANLPAPDIADGSDYFDTLTWSGTGGGSGSTRSLTGLEFSPSFVWGKVRSSSGVGHILMDAVRGVGTGKYLQTNTNNAEGTSGPNESLYGYLSSLDSNGFTVTNGTSTFDNWNKSGDTYVAWNWLAGNGTSSNTDGGITSTVSANPTAGFSIVTYDGSAQNDTVGHGLGVAPSLIIFKRRNATTSWPVYHSTISPSNVVYLNETAAQASSGNSFGSTPTAPTSSVFSVGDKGDTNYGDMLAYCFAEVEGYSKFGSYTGNGSTDGPFIYTGFRPAWVLIKATNTNDWYIFDTARRTYNPTYTWLKPNTTDSEAANSTSDVWDILSNGFKPRNLNGNQNGNGTTFIYAAFAEHPFGGSGVSPATAR